MIRDRRHDAPLIGIAGLGTVGAGVVQAAGASTAELLAPRGGRPLMVVAVSARDRGKKRGVDLAGLRWYERPAGAGRRRPTSTWSSS